MKIKLLLVSAIAIVGMAVYTLTLSFTNTTPLLSQLEALATLEVTKVKIQRAVVRINMKWGKLDNGVKNIDGLKFRTVTAAII